MQKNYKEELKINKYVSDKFDKFKKKINLMKEHQSS